MTEKHSPLPWRNVGSGQAADATGKFAASAFIAPTSMADAHEAEYRINLIVRSVNGLPEAIAALEKLMLAYVNLLEVGRDRIVALGGDCDPVDVMEAGDPVLRATRAALTKLKG